MKDVQSVIAKWDKCKMIERKSMVKYPKSEEIIYNHLFYAQTELQICIENQNIIKIRT